LNSKTPVFFGIFEIEFSKNFVVRVATGRNKSMLNVLATPEVRWNGRFASQPRQTNLPLQTFHAPKLGRKAS